MHRSKGMASLVRNGQVKGCGRFRDDYDVRRGARHNQLERSIQVG